MVDDDIRRAEEFRDIAARLRALARTARSDRTRSELWVIAERFEQMAAEIDPREEPTEPER